jgi:hypothetical protein
MYHGSNEAKADNALKFLQKLRDENKTNYGVVTSIDNRISVIKSYAKRKQWDALERFYAGEKEEGYLAGWENK